jgi:hypothetical protein
MPLYMGDFQDQVRKAVSESGCLDEITPKIRSVLYAALVKSGKYQPPSKTVQRCMNSHEGLICISLFKEFLELYGMNETLSVFTSETGCENKVKNREQLQDNLNIKYQKPENSVLHTLIDRVRNSRFELGPRNVLDRLKLPSLNPSREEAEYPVEGMRLMDLLHRSGDEESE